jgi:hypothetical protein
MENKMSRSEESVYVPILSILTLSEGRANLATKTKKYAFLRKCSKKNKKE